MSFRSEIKSFAKKNLKKQYCRTFSACMSVILPILFVMLTIAALICSGVLILHYGIGLVDTFGIFILCLASLMCAFSLFFYPFVYAGLADFALTIVHDRSERANYPYVSGAKNYGKKLCSLIWVDIFTLFWTILLIFPGFIKAYSYSFTKYILSEYPEVGARQAIRISNRITDGIKKELFLFDLSFIGWWALTILTLGLASIYTLPYYLTSHATLYESMKNNALQTGKITEADLFLSNACEYEDNCENTVAV